MIYANKHDNNVEMRTSMSIKVSIIIPVYNAKNTLINCLSTVVNQTLKDIEIILVNDASTDDSLTILEECERQFPDKIKVINCEENRGAGGARNIGMLYSEGEYIGFVDSDDMIDSSMYEKLYNKAKGENYDIVDCGFFNEKTETAIIYTSDELTGELDAEKRSKLIVSGGYIWSKIFKNSFIRGDSNFQFREHSILEDSEFITYAFATAKNIGNVKEILYKYTYQGTSLTNSTYGKRYIENLYSAMNAIYNCTVKLEGYENIREAVEYEILQMYSYGVLMCLKEYIDKGTDMRNSLEQFRKFRMENVTSGYKNKYVIEKICEKDIEIMQKNDENPQRLLKFIKNKKKF